MRHILVFRLAFKALRRNLMRTMLTMLGVIIGVSAVICTIAIGEGASGKIQDAIASVGANVVWVEAALPRRRRAWCHWWCHGRCGSGSSISQA